MMPTGHQSPQQPHTPIPDVWRRNYSNISWTLLLLHMPLPRNPRPSKSVAFSSPLKRAFTSLNNVLEHGIIEDNLRGFISSQVVCQKLVHLKRNAGDEMVLTNAAVYSIFRRFSGHRPNYHSSYKFMNTIAAFHARSAGVLVEDFR